MMATPSWTEIVMRLLILLSAGGAPQIDGGAAGVNIEALFAAEQTVVYIEFDANAARRLIDASPQTSAALLQGKSPETAAAQAATAFGDQLRFDPTALRQLVTETRRVGVWLLSFTDRLEDLRYLIVVERSTETPVAAQLLRRLIAPTQAGAGPRYTSFRYADADVHGLIGPRGSGVWIAESGSLLAIGSDPLVVKSFLLRSTRQTPSGSTPALLRAVVHVPRAMEHSLRIADERNRWELLATAAMLDMASWREATLTLDGKGIEARLALDKSSRLRRVLRAPEKAPRIADTLPDNSAMSVVLALADASQLGAFVRSGLDEVAAIDPRYGGEVARALDDFAEETGVDPQADLFGNVTAIALAIPPFEGTPGRSFLVAVEVRDADRADTALRVAQLKTMGGVIPETEIWGARVWEKDNIQVGIKNDVIVAAFGPDASFDDFLRRLDDAQSNEAGALATLRVNHPALSSISTAPPLKAELRMEGDGLVMKVGLDSTMALEGLAAMWMGRNAPPH